MAVKRGITVQSAADTFTQTQVTTGIVPDGKTGWLVTDIVGYWSTGEIVVAGDIEVNLSISTVVGVTAFDNIDELFRINWAISNTAGVAVAYPLSLIQRMALSDGGRLTVQPILYLGVASSGTGAANTVSWEVRYETVKLSDLEVLRLLQGGV